MAPAPCFTGTLNAARARDEVLKIIAGNVEPETEQWMHNLMTQLTDKHDPTRKAVEDLRAQDAMDRLDFRIRFAIETFLVISPRVTQQKWGDAAGDYSKFTDAILYQTHGTLKSFFIMQEYRRYYEAVKEYQTKFDKLQETRDRALAKIEQLEDMEDDPQTLASMNKVVQECDKKENDLARKIFTGELPLLPPTLAILRDVCYTGDLQAARARDDAIFQIDRERKKKDGLNNDLSGMDQPKDILKKHSPITKEMHMVMGEDHLRYREYMLNFEIEMALCRAPKAVQEIWEAADGDLVKYISIAKASGRKGEEALSWHMMKAVFERFQANKVIEHHVKTAWKEKEVLLARTEKLEKKKAEGSAVYAKLMDKLVVNEFSEQAIAAMTIFPDELDAAKEAKKT